MRQQFMEFQIPKRKSSFWNLFLKIISQKFNNITQGQFSIKEKVKFIKANQSIFISKQINKIKEKKMQKWQQKHRKRIHQSIIQNAKPTINLNENLTKSRQKPPITTSRSKQLRASHHTKQQNSFLPFVKILELFQLQKYSNVLIEHGFPHKLAEKKSTKFIDDILTKVQQQDQQRFLSLMNTLTIMSKDILKQTSTKNFVKNPLTRQKNIKSLHYPPPSNATNTNFRKSYNNLTTSKKSQKAALFKVRQTNNFKIPVTQMTQINLTTKYSLSQKSRSIDKIKDRKYLLQNPNVSTNGKNSKTPKKRHRQAYDDAYITHTFRNSNQTVPQKISKSNRIIQKLMQKLKKMNPQKYMMKRQSAFDINLDLEKIKKMYLSFDSATLTSNIHNIDLEEIIDCFVQEIYRSIDQNILTQKKSIKGFMRSERKKGIREPSCKYIEFDNKQQIEYLLKESLVFDKSQDQVFTKAFNPQSSAKKLQLMKEPISTQEFICDQLQNDIKNAATKSVSISSNSSQSDFQVDYEIQSFVQDFGCFDSNLQNSMTKVEKSDIKNFIQLVIMAGKMEKQMPIIAYMYLKKLFKSKRLYRTKPKLTLCNWKNIVLVILISASKVWDDTSLENHSFSKVIKPYTTYEINRLEKYFLYYIDYQLTVDQKQYCQSYFQLRKNSVNAKKTAHLMSLDVKTIKELENKKYGIKKKQTQLKDYYKNKMDKSF